MVKGRTPPPSTHTNIIYDILQAHTHPHRAGAQADSEHEVCENTHIDDTHNIIIFYLHVLYNIIV